MKYLTILLRRDSYDEEQEVVGVLESDAPYDLGVAHSKWDSERKATQRDWRRAGKSVYAFRFPTFRDWLETRPEVSLVDASLWQTEVI